MHKAVLVVIAGSALAALTVSLSFAKPGRFVNERQIQRALRLAFPTKSEAWSARLLPDETMATCAEWKNQPSPEVAEALKRAEAKRIVRPPDGQFMGDWRRGERIAQSGYGMRFTDTDQLRANGGNCYACHQLAPDEVSYGTLGVSLQGFGRTHRFDPAYARAVYDKVFNSQAAVACSMMPRFGVNGILSMEQIKDVVAFLMHPESPVNREKVSAGADPDATTDQPPARDAAGAPK